MKMLSKKIMAVILCLVMVLGLIGVPSAGAAQSAPQSNDKVIYVTDSKTTYVPAGYTYVYESTDGRIYTRKATVDTYISGRTLSATEAKALASLNYGAESTITTDDGQTLVCREYDAKEAAAYSNAVKAILQGEDYKDGDKVTVLSQAHEKKDKVKVIIQLEAPAVAQMDGMKIQLGTGLGKAEQAAAQKVKDGQTNVISAAKTALGHSLEVTGQFSLVTNAISATVSYGEMAALSKLAGVKKVFLSPSYSVPEINAVETDAAEITTNMKFSAEGMGAPGAWDSGFDGTGMSVAVIDTGLCFMNPTFEKEPEDAEAVAFSKDDIASILATKDLHAETLDESTSLDTVYYSSKVPFGFNYADGEANFGSDDDTWMGHGTHVAGIIAGNLTEEDQEQFDMTYLGIAPEAQLVIMKVFDMAGDCYFDYLIAAIEDAIALGVDCANLSLGSSSGPAYYEGITEVYDAATEAGISVCVSAGNDGFTGTESLWGDEQIKSSSVSSGTLGMPGTFDSVLTVASAENQAVKWLNDTGVLSWYNEAKETDQLMSLEEVEGVPEENSFYMSLRAKDVAAGQSYEYTESMEDAAGKIVFVAFEGGNGDAVVAEAKTADAAGVVFYDPTPEEDDQWAYIDVALTNNDVPAARANKKEFDWMKQNNHSGVLSVMADWNRNKLAGEMSSFSSWGPTEGLTLKPEITGIGGNVFSAYYGEYFAVASGTSMSSPAVAASMALLRQYLKTTSIPESDYVQVANCLLMSTAQPMMDEANNNYYFVRRQGAGLANVANAVKSEAYISVDGTNKAKLELGDDKEKSGVYEMTFNVVNFSQSAKTYDISVIGLGQAAEGGLVKGGQVTYLTQNYAAQLDAEYTTSFEGDKVTVPAGSSAEVTVTVTLSDAQKAYYDQRFPYGAYVEGFVQLTSKDSVSLSVPYLAFYGDFSAAPVLEEGSVVTTLGGTRAYNTVDQVNTGMFSYRTTSTDPSTSWMTDWALLGSTAAPGYYMVPMEDFKFNSMFHEYKGFEPNTAGISPNSDLSMDEFHLQIGLLRNASNIHYTVTNLTTGQILSEQDTDFMQKSFAKSVYAGSDDFDLSWLYETEVYGDEVYVNYDNCLLPEDTQISIKAEITPECEGGQTQTTEFKFYIDTTGPMSQKPTVAYTVDDFDWGWGPMTTYTFAYETDEKWWVDYDMEISLEYDEETDTYYASAFTSTYFPDPDPMGEGVHGRQEVGMPMVSSDCTEIFLGYDYAGNCSAYTIVCGNLASNISLSAEKDTIYVGDELTIKNTDCDDYDALLTWEVSDPEIAEIVDSTDSTVTIKGLKRGDVTVTGAIGDFKNSIVIHVMDENYENLKDKFQDIAGHWAEDIILDAVYDGLFTGVTENTFDPDSPITRAMFVQVLYRMDGQPEVTEKAGFEDVADTSYYADAVAWAAENGIVTGVSKTSFNPEASITREQMAVILYRYASYTGADVSAEADFSAYADAADVSAYAVDAMKWVVGSGIINGVSATKLNPAGTATRAQGAAVLERFQDAAKG